jgi:hypothetical protein
MGMPIDRADTEKAREVLAEVLAQVSELDADIERYWNDGWMPVVVLAPKPAVISMLRGLGWKDRPCFGVRRSALKPMLKYPSERRWLEQPRKPGLIQAFLAVHLGTMLLVREPGTDLWSVEPGTLDRELLD